MVALGASSDFVGRSRELEEVERLLTGSRLVTVIGAPGAGKTRLAVEIAARLAPQFAGGVYACELAPVATPALVNTAVATAIGFPPEASGDLAALTQDRFGDTPALVLVDNCEHVRPEIAALLRSMLAAAPGLRVLATSRERLRITGETAWTLPSMNLDEALQLLENRVRTSDASFAVTQDNRSSLVEVCERLEGLPLALELVAPRLALLPATQVADMLNASIDLLRTSEGPSRHRTMTAALDWSVALLPTTSALDLWRLSVFPAGFALDAAAVVLEASPEEAVDRLAVLRDASILLADKTGAEAKFRLLEPVRQYASLHLAGGPIEEDVQRLHAMYVLHRAEWIGARLLGTPEQAAAFEAFNELLPDLRQAVRWALHAKPDWAARIIGHTGWAWEITSRIREGEALMRSTLQLSTDVRDRARLLARLLSLVYRRNREDSAAIGPEAVRAATEAGDRLELGLVLCLQTMHLSPEAAARQLDTVAEIADETGYGILRCWERFMRAYWYRDTGDMPSARASMEQAAKIAATLGDRWCATQATSYAAEMCLALGDNEAARQHLLSMLPGFARHADWLAAHELLSETAQLACAAGRPADALRLEGAAHRLRDEIGLRQWDQTIERGARAQLRDPALEFKCLYEGQHLSLGDALAVARDVLESSGSPSEGRKRGSVLTRREREVARLVEQGLTNREIASRLFITERTAEGHVEQIRNKLGLQTKAQLAAWAARERLTAETANSGTENP